jgi:hypothetical protein
MYLKIRNIWSVIRVMSIVILICQMILMMFFQKMVQKNNIFIKS